MEHGSKKIQDHLTNLNLLFTISLGKSIYPTKQKTKTTIRNLHRTLISAFAFWLYGDPGSLSRGIENSVFRASVICLNMFWLALNNAIAAQNHSPHAQQSEAAGAWSWRVQRRGQRARARTFVHWVATKLAFYCTCFGRSGGQKIRGCSADSTCKVEQGSGIMEVFPCHGQTPLFFFSLFFLQHVTRFRFLVKKQPTPVDEHATASLPGEFCWLRKQKGQRGATDCNEAGFLKSLFLWI